MKLFQRIAYVAVLAASVSFLSSCANDDMAQERVSNKPSRYAMTLPQIKEAATKGDADAQYALGFMYYYGKKVDRDMTLAKKWIHKAAAQGQSRAITAMKLLGDSSSATTHVAKSAKPTTTTTKGTKIATIKPTPKFHSKTTTGTTTSTTAKVSTTTPTTTAKVSKKPTGKKVAIQAVQPIRKPPVRVAKTTTLIKQTQVASAPVVKTVITEPQLKAFEKWLMTKQDDHFTLQLLGSRNLDQVEKVIQENHLANKSAIYHTMYKSKPWYVLVYGDYETPDDALAAIDRLPPMAQQLKPWVKPFASVKVGIRMSEHSA